MESKFITRVKYDGTFYDVKLRQTSYKGLEMEFYDCVNNRYLFDTWRNADTVEGVLIKWYNLLKGKDVEIVT